MSAEQYILSLLSKKPNDGSSQLNYISQRTSPSIKYSNDRLTVKYTNRGHPYAEIVSVQSALPATKEEIIYYYEVKINEAGVENDICIGLALQNFPINKHPGLTKKNGHSYGYRSDGKVYQEKRQSPLIMAKFTKGDIVGCGLNFVKNELFFTHNGTYKGAAFRIGQIGIEITYPTIGLHTPGECITANFGQKPFKFNLSQAIEDEKRVGIRCIVSQKIQSFEMHQIVQEYLYYHGYFDTLKTFQEQAHLEESEIKTQKRPKARADRKKLKSLKNGVYDHKHYLIRQFQQSSELIDRKLKSKKLKQESKQLFQEQLNTVASQQQQLQAQQLQLQAQEQQIQQFQSLFQQSREQTSDYDMFEQLVRQQQQDLENDNRHVFLIRRLQRLDNPSPEKQSGQAKQPPGEQPKQTLEPESSSNSQQKCTLETNSPDPSKQMLPSKQEPAFGLTEEIKDTGADLASQEKEPTDKPRSMPAPNNSHAATINNSKNNGDQEERPDKLPDTSNHSPEIGPSIAHMCTMDNSNNNNQDKISKETTRAAQEEEANNGNGERPPDNLNSKTAALTEQQGQPDQDKNASQGEIVIENQSSDDRKKYQVSMPTIEDEKDMLEAEEQKTFEEQNEDIYYLMPFIRRNKPSADTEQQSQAMHNHLQSKYSQLKYFNQIKQDLEYNLQQRKDLLQQAYLIKSLQDRNRMEEEEENRQQELNRKTIEQCLVERKEIKALVMEGQVQAAIEKLSLFLPDVLKNNEQLRVQLHSQQFIELIKQSNIFAAIEYAQQNLQTAVKHKIKTCSEQSPEITVENATGLICYEDPAQSELSYLMQSRQREVTWDLTNQAILKELGFENQSVMETLIMQLMTIEEKLREQNFNYGDTFQFSV